MKRPFTILAFVLASIVDVRVKAAPVNPHPVELPGGCWAQIEHQAKNSPCAFLNGDKRQLMNLPFGQLRMSPEASVVVSEKNGITMRLIRGVFWFSVQKPITIKTLYAQVRVTSGDVLISAQDRHSDITNLTSDLKYRPRGSTNGFVLPKGMVVTMGRVTSAGVARTEFPRTANVKTLLQTWAHVYARSDMDEFQKHIEEFLPSWVQATEDVGPWYTNVVNRELASAEQDKERQARLLSKQQHEINRLRHLFRAQNFIN